MGPRIVSTASGAILAGLLLALPSAAYEVSCYAGINQDGTLQIKGKTIRLFGIYIPDTERTCSRNRQPPICGSRASVALEFKIDGFVRCDLHERHADNTYTGLCRVNAAGLYGRIEKCRHSYGQSYDETCYHKAQNAW